MKLNRKALITCTLVLYGSSFMATGGTYTGKIVIDGVEYGSGFSGSTGSSGVLEGNGKVVTKQRELGFFDQLSVQLTGDVNYVAADQFSLKIKADENIVPVITSEISGGVLVLDTDRSYSTQSKLQITVFGPPSLKGLVVDGSADVNMRGIDTGSLQIGLDGSGDVTAQGRVDSLLVKVDGSGDVSAKELIANNVMVATDGSTEVVVTAKNRLDVTVDGVGEVTYYGNPATVNKAIDGVGDVKPGN